MSQDRPERPPVANFMAALEVKRNAAIGLVVGVGFTIAVYLFFVVTPGEALFDAYYLALAFTLATTTAGTVAVVLTVFTAITLSRRLADEG